MSILLRGGTLLLHDSNDHVIPTKSDLLITGNIITKIAPEIEAEKGTMVIDCTDKIVSPGFIDTHRHLWQTPLKGRHANELLLGLQAIEDSGIRSIWCYCAHHRIKSWHPLEFEDDVLPPWYWDQLRGFMKTYQDGRVRIGVAWDTWFFGEEKTKKWFKEFREMGVKLITSHSLRGPTLNFNAIEPLVTWNLIGKDTLLSHATGISPTEANQILTGGAHISSTPTTELQMSLGQPLCFHPVLSSISSLGVDCHSAAAADIPGQMRLILQYARGVRNQGLLDRGRTPRTVGYGVEEVFNLGTVKGARAVGMEDQVGRLRVGMRADLVVWEGLSSGMVGAVQQDPVAGIVLHSSVRDVDTVIVDGIIRKRDGKLVPVTIGGKGEDWKKKTERMEWRDIARRVVETRDRVQEKVKGIDYEKVKPIISKAFYIDEGTLSDTLPSDDN